jgi:hypothetical protein
MNVNRKIGIKIGIFWLFFCFSAMRTKLCDKNGTVKGLRKKSALPFWESGCACSPLPTHHFALHRFGWEAASASLILAGRICWYMVRTKGI